MKKSYMETISLLKEYNPNSDYKVGDKAIHDAKIYKCRKPVKAPMAWDKSCWKECPYESAVGVKKENILEFENLKLAPDRWREWEPDADRKRIHDEFPYRARLTCKGVSANMIPYILFSTADALSGLYAPIAESGKNVIYIYARKQPTEKMCIPSVKCVDEQTTQKGRRC